MNVIKVTTAISSERRLKVISLIDGKKYSAIDLYKKLRAKSDKCIHRETVYRDSEKLVKVGIIKKANDQSVKTIYYSVIGTKLIINLVTNEVKLI